jgi:hypothetical protein
VKINHHEGKATDHGHKASQRNHDKQPATETSMNFIRKAWDFVRNPAHSGAVVAILTFVLAIAGIVYTVFSILQWSVMRQTMENGERAFVFVKDPFLVGDGGKPGVPSGKPAWLAMNLMNSGETPARDAKVAFDYCATAGELPDNFSFAPGPTKQPIMLLAPKSEGQTSFQLPDTVLYDLEAGKRNLFVYGEVSYTDIFGEWHKTEFCSKYRGFVLNMDGTMDKFIWSACDKHNCHDGDCPEKWGDAPCPQIGAKLIPAP